MKKSILYLLLFTYTSMMCKPLLPFASDLLAHTFFYQDHMTTIHVENGNLHVHYEAVKAAKEANDETKPVNLKKDHNSWDHLVAAAITKPFSTGILKSYPLYHAVFYPAPLSHNIFSPPRFS